MLPKGEVKEMKGLGPHLCYHREPPILCEDLFAVLSFYFISWVNRDQQRVVSLFLITRTSKASSGMMMIQREIMNQRSFSMEFR